MDPDQSDDDSPNCEPDCEPIPSENFTRYEDEWNPNLDSSSDADKSSEETSEVNVEQP